ncbi:MAG: helix-hairpin-helix domain-containing protein [Acetobacteraceae bacterium]|nr:helix-hairpin-helix domain-containing protein [Acetobacteraceae bacterium]
MGRVLFGRAWDRSEFRPGGGGSVGYFSRAEQVVVLLLVAGLLAGCGLLSWQALARRGEPIPAGPAPGFGDPDSPEGLARGGDGANGASAPAEVTVHVCGAVARPGVYRFRPGSRVQDAITAAGGAAPGAALEALNLAAPLRDGQKVEVPEKPPGGQAKGPSARAPGVVPPTPDNPLDLNSAGRQALEALPGIGPRLAERVLRYREEHGPFRRVEDLLEVEGIGPRTLERLRPLVRVD